MALLAAFLIVEVIECNGTHFRLHVGQEVNILIISEWLHALTA